MSPSAHNAIVGLVSLYGEMLAEAERDAKLAKLAWEAQLRTKDVEIENLRGRVTALEAFEAKMPIEVGVGG